MKAPRRADEEYDETPPGQSGGAIGRGLNDAGAARSAELRKLVNHMESNGSTPLLRACQNGFAKVSAVLLASGAGALPSAAAYARRRRRRRLRCAAEHGAQP